MKVTHFLVAAGIALAATSAHAGLTTYDFDGFADGSDISGIDLGGAVLTAGTAGIGVTGGAGSGASGIDGALNMFGVINVSLDLIADDGGEVFLSAFAPGNFLINSFTGNGGAVSIFAPNSVSISFGSVNGAGITFDNLVLETIDVAGGSDPGGTAVPIPGALPLMATAFAGVAFLGARRRR